MLCSISGHVPTEPMVSIKSGHVFERSLIEKYIRTHNKCPITDEPLALEDIIPLKIANTNVKPRPTTATSIPGMLQMFQSEWDAIMLENYTLNQQLLTLRQELAQTLYQHDAACRVIARLTKERDEARKIGAAAQSVSANKAMEVESNVNVDAVREKIAQTASSLSKARKKRVISPTLRTPTDIGAYTEIGSFPLHSTTQPGITCCDISTANSDLIVTGGIDGDVCIFNAREKKISATLSGHTKRINSVMFHKERDVIVSSSQDKVVRVWVNGKNGYESGHLLRGHTQSVSSADIHPSGDYILSSGMDNAWIFWDIATGNEIFKNILTEGTGSYTCSSIHPDGVLFGIGNQDTTTKLWDIKDTKKPAVVLEGHISKVSNISFSENGFYLATASDDSTVRLWDLREVKNFHTITLDYGTSANYVSFDHSGKYLVVASAKDIRVYHGRTFAHVATFNNHTAPLNCAKFGPDANFIASVSMDRTLKIFGSK